MLVVFQNCALMVPCVIGQVNLVLQVQNDELLLVQGVGEIWWLE